MARGVHSPPLWQRGCAPPPCGNGGGHRLVIIFITCTDLSSEYHDFDLLTKRQCGPRSLLPLTVWWCVSCPPVTCSAFYLFIGSLSYRHHHRLSNYRKCDRFFKSNNTPKFSIPHPTLIPIYTKYACMLRRSNRQHITDAYHMHCYSNRNM